MKISNEDKKQLRRLGHKINPVVTVATKGLSENVLAEIDRALTDHELIKVKFSGSNQQSRANAVEIIREKCGAEVVQSIGHVLLLLKKSNRPNPKLSNLIR
jgi:RNA-binding protein